jgi:replicative DNA helicase
MTFPFEEEDFDEILGPIEPLPPEPPDLRIVGEPASESLPSADELNQEQVREAVNRLFENTSDYPRFPWGEVDEVAGALCPEDLWIVVGRTGNGKSLFLLNLFDGLISHDRRGLYVGLEQSPKILRIKWACLRQGIKPKFILAPTSYERSSTQWELAKDAVAEELKWQKTPEIKLRAHFSATRMVDRERLQSWTEWAVDMGCDFVIVDHVDRMQHGEGKNSFHELSNTIRLAKELAVEHRIVMILASQCGRPSDKLEKFMPPGLNDLRGAGTKEEEADSVLAVYRPLREGTKAKEMTAVRQGLADETSIYEPNKMAIRVLKHRLDGEVLGRQAMLSVEKGRLKSIPLQQFGRIDL